MSEQDSRYVDGEDGEKWSVWLVPNGKDEYDEIKDSSVKNLVRSLARRPDALTPTEKLVDYYDRLEAIGENLSSNSEDYNQLQQYLQRIAQRAIDLEQTNKNSQELTDVFDRFASEMSGEGRLRLPRNPEEQRSYVRQVLDAIESTNQDCFSYANATHTRGLEASLKDMHESVREEVVQRLAVHDSSELVRQAGGYIKKDGAPTIGAMATEAQRRGHDLTRRTVELLLVDGLPGLEIAKAWDLLQDANYYYSDIIRNINLSRFTDLVGISLPENDRVVIDYLVKTKREFEGEENLIGEKYSLTNGENGYLEHLLGSFFSP
ncbi:hypothetical protein KW795_02880, partial [Candidatus Microgenomates bacterium]|nr:hypothetical protein [Candidatus Microgenomates bacterium]